MSPCTDGVYGLDKVFDSMLGAQGAKDRPCGLWKVGEELVVLISCVGNGAEVERQGSCFIKWRRKYTLRSQVIFPLGPLGAN